MLHTFINRESEWQFLDEAYGQKRAQLIVVYGRRRVGKSYLTSRFVNEKNGVYYLCSKGNETEQLELLSNKLADTFKDNGLISRPFTKWHDFFVYLNERAKERRIAIEFDEFPFLISANPAVPSLFQKYWDEYLSQSNVYLIICGSSIGMMEAEVLGRRSPLYGRRTGQWKLQPLRFKHAMEFFKPSQDLEQGVEMYAIAGGMPFYLTELDRDRPAIENILTHIAKRGKPLLVEGEFLVKEELPEAATYFSILHAIAKGETRSIRIANHVGIPASGLTRYLINLQRLGFIEKTSPITDKPRSKKSLYFIADNFLNFWFRFIYPNRSYIEEEDYEKVRTVLRMEWNLYVSRVFEDVCSQAMRQWRKAGKVNFDKIGRWWGAYRKKETGERKTEEIDIVGLNDSSKEILLGECKWQSNVNAEAILKELQDKARMVEWNAGKRTEHFILFAKSFKEKKGLGENVQLIDLKDLEKIFRG